MRAIFSGLLALVLTVPAFAAEARTPAQEGIVYGVADGQPLTELAFLAHALAEPRQLPGHAFDQFDQARIERFVEAFVSNIYTNVPIGSR